MLNIEQAIKVSSDDFFYNLGVLTNNPAPRGGALQKWARLYGIGQATGIDVGGELAGTLPTPTWRAQRNKLEYQCDNAVGPFRYTNGHKTVRLCIPGWRRSAKHPPGGCGIADGTNRPWSAGDNENLAVGQGDVQVTPLQLAVAYSAIANGGRSFAPTSALTSSSRTGPSCSGSAPRGPHFHINPLYLHTIRAGLRAAASQPGGTSFSVMGNFPEQVYGKTGTAQYTGQPDYSWYSCFVPASATSKPIEVVVTVPRAGFGVQAAAPVARQILSQWFFGRKGPFLGGGTSRRRFERDHHRHPDPALETAGDDSLAGAADDRPSADAGGDRPRGVLAAHAERGHRGASLPGPRTTSSARLSTRSAV